MDVDTDIFLRVFHLEEKQLGDDGVRHGVIDCRSDENDAILQEAGVDVVGAFATARLFNDAGNEVVGLGIDAHFYKLPTDGVLQKEINGFSAQKSVSK